VNQVEVEAEAEIEVTTKGDGLEALIPAYPYRRKKP